jgi:flagellar biosynthesis protein FlhB
MALKARGASAGTHAAPRPTTADEVSTVIDPTTLVGDVTPRRLRTPRTVIEGAPA